MQLMHSQIVNHRHRYFFRPFVMDVISSDAYIVWLLVLNQPTNVQDVTLVVCLNQVSQTQLPTRMCSSAQLPV